MSEEELELEEQELLEDEPVDENMITMNYRGEEVHVTQDKAIELAQKGFDYETKMAHMKEESKDYAGYEAMTQWMRENPDEAAKVRDIIAGQDDDPVEEEQDDDWMDAFDEPEEDNPPAKKQRPKADKEIQALKRTVEELRQERDEKKAKEETKQMGNYLRQEVSKYPALEEFGELAYAPILGVLASQPNADPAQVVKAVNAQFEEKLREIKNGFVKKKTDTLERLPEEMPSGKEPTILHKKSFGAKDLDSGDLRRAVLANFMKDD